MAFAERSAGHLIEACVVAAGGDGNEIALVEHGSSAREQRRLDPHVEELIDFIGQAQGQVAGEGCPPSAGVQLVLFEPPGKVRASAPPTAKLATGTFRISDKRVDIIRAARKAAGRVDLGDQRLIRGVRCGVSDDRRARDTEIGIAVTEGDDLIDSLGRSRRGDGGCGKRGWRPEARGQATGGSS